MKCPKIEYVQSSKDPDFLFLLINEQSTPLPEQGLQNGFWERSPAYVPAESPLLLLIIFEGFVLKEQSFCF